MNKEKFIEELVKKTSYNKEKCIIINDILEDNFIVGKKNKVEIVNKLIEKLEINKDEAEKIYNIAMGIITISIKNSIKHPFKSKDD